ncbi:MAG: hydrogenase 3 maturation endopeptidase HyCI, partial [Anaerolineae bacterium]|nr:hydrogenase 3 maturation endopeptidase HyCI [Anaerolineae bacterium]
MSKPSWPQQLQTALTQAAQTQNNPQPRVALVGIGHELNGDDAAGLAVVRALLPLAEGRDRVSLIDAGPAPENCTGPLRAFAPDLVLLIDAAQMGEEPG